MLSTRIFVRDFAGHSKFSKIMRSKGALDAARGQLLTKLSKIISSAAKAGGTDPSSNLRLAAALEAAKKASCPKDIITRALSSKEGVALSEVNFEAVGPSGVSLLIECQTDNSRRTTPAIKHILSKHNGEMQAVGTNAFVFSSKGVLTCSGEEEGVMEAALGAGAEDVVPVTEGGMEFRVVCGRDSVGAVRGALLKAGIAVTSVLLERSPVNRVQLSEESEEVFLNLLSALEEHEDVSSVVHNAELSGTEGGEDGV